MAQRFARLPLVAALVWCFAVRAQGGPHVASSAIEVTEASVSSLHDAPAACGIDSVFNGVRHVTVICGFANLTR